MLRSRWGYLLLLLMVVALPHATTSSFYRHVMTMTVMYACLAEAWNIVGGYGGQIALGNAVFFGIGAYSSALMVTKAGLSPWLGVLAGMFVSAASAAFIGYASFKTSGIYFAIATLGFGELVRTVFTNWNWVSGAVGIEMPILPTSWLNFQFHQNRLPYYYIILVVLILFYWMAVKINGSRFGYYLRTLKTSEVAAEAVGIDVPRTKMMAFVLSAVMTAVCGSFYNQYLLYIDPFCVMPSLISMLMLFMTVLGGSGTAIGPIIGAAILFPVGELTRAALGGQGRGIDLFINSVLLIVMTLAQPGGLVVLVRSVRRGHKEGKRG